MPNTPTRYARAALATTDTTLYTVPAGTTAIVTEIIVNNTTASAVSPVVSLNGVTVIEGEEIPARGLLTMGLKQVLSAGETIVARGSATGCNIFVSGVNVT